MKFGGSHELRTHNDLGLHVLTNERSATIAKAISAGFTTDSNFHGEYTTFVRNNNDSACDNRRYLYHVFRS